MPTNLPRLLPDNNARVEVQDTEFTLDVVGRYVCSTWDEVVNNNGVAFDAVVIGAGMFGAYCAEKIYRHANLRVLVLDAGGLLVTEHVQNLSRIGLNAGAAVKVEFNTPGSGAARARVGIALAKSDAVSRAGVLSWWTIAVLGRLVTTSDQGRSDAVAAGDQSIPAGFCRQRLRSRSTRCARRRVLRNGA